jgi:hypothetical protein
MLYYRVKPDMDNRKKYVYIRGSNQKIKPDGILVANELYTPGERKQIANADKFFEKVEISQRKTYWFFGARFSDETGVVIE